MQYVYAKQQNAHKHTCAEWRLYLYPVVRYPLLSFPDRAASVERGRVKLSKTTVGTLACVHETDITGHKKNPNERGHTRLQLNRLSRIQLCTASITMMKRHAKMQVIQRGTLSEERESERAGVSQRGGCRIVRRHLPLVQWRDNRRRRHNAHHVIATAEARQD